MLLRRLLLSLAIGLGCWSVVLAAEPAKPEPPKWDVNAAHGSVKSVKFTTDEGTWMDLDVSPDGSTIVFELLGDLYTLADQRWQRQAHDLGPGLRRAAALLAGRQARSPSPRIAAAATTCGGCGSTAATTAGDQGRLPPAQQSGVDARWPVPDRAQALHLRTLARRRRTVAVPQERRRRTAADQEEERSAGPGRAGAQSGRPLRVFLRRREWRQHLPVQQEPARRDLRDQAPRSRDRRDPGHRVRPPVVRCARSLRRMASGWPSSNAFPTSPCCTRSNSTAAK